MPNPETTLVWHPLQHRLKDLRQACLLSEVMPPFWERIESTTGSGFPDLTWMWERWTGFLELKQRAEFPAGKDTPVAIESITPHQRLWWRQATEAGACVHILTRVANSYYLHEGSWARVNLGLVDREALDKASLISPNDRLPDARTLMTLMWADRP